MITSTTRLLRNFFLFTQLKSNQYKTTRHRFRNHRKLRSAWIDQLELRDLPAVISWTGSANNNLWSDSANWSTGSLPTPADDVLIAPPPDTTAATPITVSLPVEVKSIQASRPVYVSGSTASIRLVSGDSNFNSGLMIDYGGLAVVGPNTSLTVAGNGVDPKNCLIVIVNEAKATFTNVTELSQAEIYIANRSSLALPDLKTAHSLTQITVDNSTFSAPLAESFTGSRLTNLPGGNINLPLVKDASGTFVEVIGPASHLNLPKLSKFDAGRFRLDQGGSISANELRVVNIAPATAWTFSWFVGENSTLYLPKLQFINALAQPSPNEAPDALIMLRKNGRISIDTSKWTMTAGKLSFSLSGDSSIDASLSLGSQSLVTGSGTITGSVDNFGKISPSGDYSPYGSLSIKGEFTSRPNSYTELQLGGPQKLDRIMIGGQATILGGELKLLFSDEYANNTNMIPEGTLQLMSWSTWGGQFAKTPDFIPRSDGLQIAAQTRYEPYGLAEVLARFQNISDTISVSDVTVPEGNEKISYGYFTIHRKGPMTVPITVNYTVTNGTARSGTNFTFPSGPITLAPGETERRIRFIIRGNTAYAGDIYFQVQLKSVSERGLIGQSTAKVTILEDDKKPIATQVAAAKKPVVPKPKAPILKPTPKITKK